MKLDDACTIKAVVPTYRERVFIQFDNTSAVWNVLHVASDTHRQLGRDRSNRRRGYSVRVAFRLSRSDIEAHQRTIQQHQCCHAEALIGISQDIMNAVSGAATHVTMLIETPTRLAWGSGVRVPRSSRRSEVEARQSLYEDEEDR